MQRKTISEYNFTETIPSNKVGTTVTITIKLKINHLSHKYSISSDFMDEKFNFQNLGCVDKYRIETIANLIKEANTFATNELLKIN